MRFLFLFLIAFSFFSCTKKEFKDVQTDSFRISILPVKNTAFNQYSLTGTLDIKMSAASIEYGVVVGEKLNPTIESDKVFKIGTSATSADFTHLLTNLDTGMVHYVRAFAKNSTEVQYSANQTIQKLSPKLFVGSNQMNYGQAIVVSTNFVTPASGTLDIRLNNTSVSPVYIGTDQYNWLVFTIIPPPSLASGYYKLSVNVGNLSITYPEQLSMLEGTWKMLEYILPRDFSVVDRRDRIVVGDWIYTNRVGIPTSYFTRYNYKTGENQYLKQLSIDKLTEGSTIVRIGDNLHWMGGELLIDNKLSKSYWIYNTITDLWDKETDLPGNGRKYAAAMHVGNKLYYGLGGAPTANGGQHYNDFWVYDFGTKKWQQLPNFPGNNRFLRAYFIINEKLYVTGGDNQQGNQVRETWCYDSWTNAWSRKADYPGEGWIDLLTYSIGNYGYVGMGKTNYTFGGSFSKIYKYKPNEDKWIEVSNFGGDMIRPFISTSESSAIIGAGYDSNGPQRSIFEFMP